MRNRIKRVKKTANVRIYDNLMQLYGVKKATEVYRLKMLHIEFKTINNNYAKI